jgi:4-amino-4-deoxy-L-arabinose transferase-like glycosyltransferase
MELRRLLGYLAVTLLFLVLFAQLVFSAGHKSATMDEVYHLFNGVTWFLSTPRRVIVMGNPPLVNILEAAPLVALDDVDLPTDPSLWAKTDWDEILTDLVHPFLWEVNGDHAHRLVFMGRLPVVGLTMLLAAGVCRWARELLGSMAGLLALLLLAFDPNILAHGRLATSDLGAACSLLWATYLFWRYDAHPNWQRFALAGLGLGFALASKFSAVLLLPVFSLLSLWPATSPGWRGWMRAVWRSGVRLLGLVVIAALVLLGAFRFDVAALWAEYEHQQMHFEAGHAAFLMGQHSSSGWWYYFLVTLALKTPIPFLILVAVGVVGLRHQRRDLAFLVLLPGVFLAASLFSTVNIGHRYLLPILPFLSIAASGGWLFVHRGTGRTTPWARYVIAVALVGWYVVGTLLVYPHYLAYFNELAGGPGGGWRYLLDSNLDWGQDLPGLKAYMEANDLNRVYLGWFGSTPPEQYGVDYVPLPSLFAYGDLWHRHYHPHRPPPGVYAISVTHLQGAYLSDPDTYAWFRDRKPVAKVGYSLFIYEVPRVGGQPISVCLSGMSVDQVDARTFDEAFGTNDVRLRWFDARGALILPAGGRDVWFLTTDEMPLAPALRERFLDGDSIWGQRRTTSGELPYTLYHLPGNIVDTLSVPASTGDMPVWWSAATELSQGYERRLLSLPLDLGHRLDLLGYELSTDRLRPGDAVELLTFWRVEQSFELPLAFFVHMLDSAGQIRGQQDGLSVDPVGMEPGDVFVQAHRFLVPPDLSAGEYPLALGVYRPDNWQRWGVYEGADVIADRVLLQAVRVE